VLQSREIPVHIAMTHCNYKRSRLARLDDGAGLRTDQFAESRL